ncbi:MAG: CopG family transcriptional regulator [Pirellulaceae bacterium]|nr:CopG family transcriptional regulator [Pirellulaceae bacterium]
MNVELPSDVNNFVRQLVITGRFASEREAVTAAIHLLMSRERLRAEVAEGFRQLDRGESFDGQEVFADVHREIDALEAHRLEN